MTLRRITQHVKAQSWFAVVVGLCPDNALRLWARHGR
jgi:hypothetical protein